MISVTTVIAGGTIAALLARKKSRQPVLELIQGNIPAPGVAGLSIQISPCGRDKKFLLKWSNKDRFRSYTLELSHDLKQV